MTVRRALLSLSLLLAAPAVPAAAQAYGYAQSGYDTDGQSVDSIEVFFEPLSHYGRWLDSRYGRVWSPNVPRDWRPYTIGHWDDGAYGPTWRSDEPFGWAVFHFGRWAYDPQIGWVWSPDTVWGPGWVAWRDGDDVAGWAPLPPQVVGFAFGGPGFNDWGYDQWYQPSWVYVPRGTLYARSLRGAYLPPARNRDLWARTRGVTRYDRVDGQVVDRSFGYGRGDDPRRDGRGPRRDGRGFDPRGRDGRGDGPTRDWPAHDGRDWPGRDGRGAPPLVGTVPPPAYGGAWRDRAPAERRDGVVPAAPRGYVPSRGFDRRTTPPLGGAPAATAPTPVPAMRAAPPAMMRPAPAPRAEPRPAPPAAVRTNPNERPR